MKYKKIRIIDKQKFKNGCGIAYFMCSLACIMMTLKFFGVLDIVSILVGNLLLLGSNIVRMRTEKKYGEKYK